MSHKNKCEEKYSKCEDKYTNKNEDKQRYREEKREAKQRHREEKRKEKQRQREEKRELKKRHRDEKRRHREEFVTKLLNLSLESPSSSSSSSNPDIQLSPERNENEVATLRTIFPDCDPLFIRSCLANETGDDRLRKVSEHLLTTDYPKVAAVSPKTPPTAPPLTRNSFESPNEGEAPPSYEESVGNQSLQPPPLPTRHQRASSWNGNGSIINNSRSVSLKPCQLSQQITQQISHHITRGAATASLEVSETIGSAVKNLLASIKPSTVERTCQKYDHVLSRQIPHNFNPKSFSQQHKILPKDKFSIQKGFNQSNYPSKDLRSHDISEEDWYYFMNGLNSLIGVNSVKGNQNNNLGDAFTVSLKWGAWMNVTMDDQLMESNIKTLNEYIDRWNLRFFNPRRINVQFVENRIQNNPFKKNTYEQFLLVRSI
ncbi:hypothetical protein RclHR1_01550028 [Rhizophagus clarus]|uniref:CUE domain-containing protein n=1 Tax=Rhizophagus clarus TaxID=94130 RepID=A0A2Z6QUE4_9GLOM|nr:hypothetical protein RclHR1_01550028 [Rhizophagus clarus]GET01145.1 hypothetical protein GLOIN_2v1522898 [Rhizophagus clarus]